MARPAARLASQANIGEVVCPNIDNLVRGFSQRYYLHCHCGQFCQYKKSHRHTHIWKKLHGEIGLRVRVLHNIPFCNYFRYSCAVN